MSENSLIRIGWKKNSEKGEKIRMVINSTICGLLRIISFSAILALMLSGITSAQEQPVNKVNIGSYWIKKRPLLIFAPSDKERDFAEQVENLKPYADSLLERDVIVLVILEEGISRSAQLWPADIFAALRV